jgi:Tol biopolymer transport system component
MVAVRKDLPNRNRGRAPGMPVHFTRLGMQSCLSCVPRTKIWSIMNGLRSVERPRVSGNWVACLLPESRRFSFGWQFLHVILLASSCRGELQIQEERLCTLPPEAFRSVVISADYKRAAYVCQDESGAWVVVNETASKTYPDLVQVLPVFSPDSKRIAFIATTVDRNKSFVVVDGKEWEPVERVATNRTLQFSPDGKRLAFVGGRADKAFVMLDGVVGPEFAGVGEVQFSSDSKRFSYVALLANGKALVVADGRPGSEYDSVRRPVFSPDGKQLAYVGRRDGQERVVLEGKELKAFQMIPGLGKEDLLQVTPFFSPDGQRMVYMAGEEGRFRMVEVDRESPVLEFFGEPTFSPDSQHLAYIGKKSGKGYLVIDGVSREIQGSGISVGARFSPDSKRFAYVLAHDRQRMCVMLDDKAQEVYEGVGCGNDGQNLFFSPDSQHLVYMAERNYQWHVVRDGVPGQGYYRVTAISFSPDSRHLAYQATSGVTRRLVVDGVEALFKAGTEIVTGHSWVTTNAVQTAVVRGDSVYRVKVTVQ